jgi:hypothetical protein
MLRLLLKQMKTLTLLLIIALASLGCSNNQSHQVETNDDHLLEVAEKVDSNATIPAAKKVNDSQVPQEGVSELGEFSLERLLSFDSEEELRNEFGKDVKRAIGYYPEGMGEYNTTVLFEDTKNEVVFVWKDDSVSFSKLLFIRLSGNKTDWHTKDGITLGTNMKQLEKVNKKPFTFYGLHWDYSGMISWDGGYLATRNISGSLDYPDGELPKKFNALSGDHEIKSSSKLAQDANLVLREIVLRKK